MHEAKLFVIEDNEAIRLLLEVALKAQGHDVVLRAETYQEAIDGLGKIASGEVEVDVITYDAQLQDHEKTGLSIFDVVNEAKAKNIGAWGIGLSSFKMSDFGIVVDPEHGPVHTDLGKEHIMDLPLLINNL